MMWRERCKRLLRGENGLRLTVLLGLAGLGCILCSSFLDGDSEAAADPPAIGTEVDADAVQEASTAYTQRLEQRLAETLSGIAGVGQCRVLLTAKSGAAYTYVQDVQQSVSAEKQEYERSCVLRKAGSQDEPLVERVLYPQITGALIVCEGGESNVVREQVYAAVRAALDLPTSQICVTKMTPAE